MTDCVLTDCIKPRLEFSLERRKLMMCEKEEEQVSKAWENLVPGSLIGMEISPSLMV
jgi:hypothetical protein